MWGALTCLWWEGDGWCWWWHWTRLEWCHSHTQLLQHTSISKTVDTPACSTLIGPGISRLGSHWSRALECWNIFTVLLCQLSYAIKNQLKACKMPPIFSAFRWFFMAGSIIVLHIDRVDQSVMQYCSMMRLQGSNYKLIWQYFQCIVIMVIFP